KLEGWERSIQEINCREFLPKRSELLLVDGKLQENQKAICQKELDAPYDSAQYVVDAPIYYFQGTYDAVTPVWQMKYHQDNQLKSKSRRYLVSKAGHSP